MHLEAYFIVFAKANGVEITGGNWLFLRHQLIAIALKVSEICLFLIWRQSLFNSSSWERVPTRPSSWPSPACIKGLGCRVLPQTHLIVPVLGEELHRSKQSRHSPAGLEKLHSSRIYSSNSRVQKYLLNFYISLKITPGAVFEGRVVLLETYRFQIHQQARMCFALVNKPNHWSRYINCVGRWTPPFQVVSRELVDCSKTLEKFSLNSNIFWCLQKSLQGPLREDSSLKMIAISNFWTLHKGCSDLIITAFW